MKHLHTFENFLNEGTLSKKNGDGEIAVMKAHKAKAEKIMSDMGLSYEDLGPKDSSLMNYYKIPDTNWDVLNKIGAKVDLQSMTVLESEVNEARAIKKGDFVRYKKDEEFTGGKVLNISSGEAEISNWDGSTIELPVADLEYIESWNR
jgi:hypothetical protein